MNKQMNNGTDENIENNLTEVRYLDVRGLARMLSMSVGAVYQLVYRREIPYRKFGRRLLFRVDEITEIIESKRIEADPTIAEALNIIKPQAA